MALKLPLIFFIPPPFHSVFTSMPCPTKAPCQVSSIPLFIEPVSPLELLHPLSTVPLDIPGCFCYSGWHPHIWRFRGSTHKQERTVAFVFLGLSCPSTRSIFSIHPLTYKVHFSLLLSCVCEPHFHHPSTEWMTFKLFLFPNYCDYGDNEVTEQGSVDSDPESLCPCQGMA